MGQRRRAVTHPKRREVARLRLLVLASLLVPLLGARPASAVEWQTYLKEDYSEEQSMFYTGQAGEAYYRIDPDARYVIDGLQTASDSLSALTDKLYYYYAEGSCEVLESSAGDLAFCGLIFHYHKTGDGQLAYYVFYTYGDGYYGAKRVEGEQSDIIIPLAKSSLVNAQGANILGVDAQGSRFDLYINGKYVDGFTDTGVDGGGFGFYVSKHSLGAFDDFIVRIEKRDGGRETPEAPSVAEGGAGTAKDYFDGYHPPEIPKDPERPLYPWEVGYDKSQKAKQKKGAGEEGKSAKAQEQKGPKESRPGAAPAKPPMPPEDSPAEGAGDPAADGPAAEPDKAVEEPKESRPGPADEDKAEPAPSKHGREKEARPGGTAAEPDDSAAPPLGAGAGAVLPVSAGAAAEVDPDGAPVAEEDMGTVEERAPEETPPALEAGAPVVEAPPPPEVEAAPDSTDAGPGAARGEYSQPTANADGSLADDPSAAADKAPEEQPRAKVNQPAAAEGQAPPPAKEKAKRARINLSADDWDSSRATPVASPAKPAAKKEPQGAPAAAEARPGVEPEAQPPVDSPLPPAGDQPGTALSELTASQAASEAGLPPPPESEPARGEPDSAAPTESGASGQAAESPEAPPAPAAPTGSEIPAPEMAEADPEAPLPRAEVPGGGADEAAEAVPPEPAAAAQTDRADDSASAATAEPVAPPDTPPANPYYGGAAEDTPLSELLPDYQASAALDTPLSALLGEDGGAEMDELPLPPAPADPLAEGAPGLVRLDDDFESPRWPVSQSATASYAYGNGRYRIENQHAETMAISYQEDSLTDCALSVEAHGSGDPSAGFGLAARFRLNGGSISYYGLFVSEAGEFLLLKVLDGKEYVLRDWGPAPARSGSAPWRLALECRGSEIVARINGEDCARVQDSDLGGGGYALLGGPGAAASFDNFSLRGQR